MSISAQELWPDGTPMDQWFADTMKVNPQNLGQHYTITEFFLFHRGTSGNDWIILFGRGSLASFNEIAFDCG